MMKCYTLQDDKPKFKYGDRVLVDMSVLCGGKGLIDGKIVGKGSEHVIDMWLVEFKNDFGPTYPFKVTSVFHTAIVKHDRERISLPKKPKK